MNALGQFLNWLRRVLLCAWRGLWLPRIPLVFQILAFSITFYAAVWVTPWVQSLFEQNRVKSEYLLSQLNGLSEDTHEFMRAFRTYTDGRTPSDMRSGARATALNALTSLHWRSIEMLIVFDGENTQEIYDYQDSIASMIVYLDRGDDEASVRSGYIEFSVATARLMNKLSEVGDFETIDIENLYEEGGG